MRTLLALALVGCCACGRTTTYTRPAGCTRPAPQASGLTIEELNGQPRLWNLDVCIPFTYAPSLEPLRPALDAALDAWSSQSCSGLCFGMPAQRADGPVDDHDYRLHASDTGGIGTGAWEMVNDGNTGKTLHATIFVSTSSSVGDLLKQIGQTIGFKTGFGKDSVLDELQVPNPRTDLGSVDKTGVCATYPPCR